MRAQSKVVVALLLALMTSGCGPGEPVQWTAPVTVDLAALRCLDADAKARAEFKRVPPPPAGEGGLSIDEWKAATDRLRESVIRKNAAGNRVIQDLDRCRAETTPAPVTGQPVS